MKIGIQPTPIGFTNHWIKYFEDNKIPYKIIDCYRNDVIESPEHKIFKLTLIKFIFNILYL